MRPDMRGSIARRCPSCRSRVGLKDRQCPICGEFQPWRFSPRGVVVETLLVVAVVVVVVGGLQWLRRQGAESLVAEPEATVRYGVLDAVPTDPSTFTPPPAPSSTRPPNTPLPPTATPLPETVAYVVTSGDTLFGIAIQFETTADDIMRQNSETLSSPHALSIGQELLIPVNRPASAPEQVAEAREPASTAVPVAPEERTDAGPAEAPQGGEPSPAPVTLPTGESVVVKEARTYTIQRGNTLGQVAAEVGVPVVELVRLNEALDGPETPLQVGQELVVEPAEIVTATPPPAPTVALSAEDLAGLDEGIAAAEAQTVGPTLYVAPLLLAPTGGVTVTQATPLLRWASAGVLPDGVTYVVQVRDVDRADADPWTAWVVSNATAIRVPGDLRPALGTSRALEWSVTVRRRSGRLLGGDGELLSPDAEWRRFVWAP